MVNDLLIELRFVFTQCFKRQQTIRTFDMDHHADEELERGLDLVADPLQHAGLLTGR